MFGCCRGWRRFDGSGDLGAVRGWRRGWEQTRPLVEVPAHPVGREDEGARTSDMLHTTLWVWFQRWAPEGAARGATTTWQ